MAVSGQASTAVAGRWLSDVNCWRIEVRLAAKAAPMDRYDLEAVNRASERRRSADGDLHHVSLQTHRPYPQALFGVFQAAAIGQAEVLLVQRRGDHQLALEAADDAAADDVRTGLGVAVVDGAQLLAIGVVG